MSQDAKTLDFAVLRHAANQLMEGLEGEASTQSSARRKRNPGVSVIIPAYSAVETISDTIVSLAAQSLDMSLFEVIVVINGPEDGTFDLASRLASEYSSLNLRLFRSTESGAGSARNLGLRLASREYVTFVDADDFVGHDFLKGALEVAGPTRIALSPIYNLVEGEVDRETTLATRIQQLPSGPIAIGNLSWALGFNACKLVHWKLLSGKYYVESLQSGEDLVFFASLLQSENLEMAVTAISDDHAYFRRMKDGSVSRQPESYEFNVAARLACIVELSELEVPAGNAAAKNQLIAAQCGFVTRYLEKHPESADQLEMDLATNGVVDFPWHLVNRGKARDLVISYCFSPFSDTSATVAGKAVAERRRIVDVISNDISKIRRKDESLSFLSSRWLDQQIVLDAPPSFAGWNQMSEFAEKALVAAERSLSVGENYLTLYSRALWVASHVAALLYKDRHRDTVWTAEFSDPLRFGVDGAPRPGEIMDNEIARILKRLVRGSECSKMEVKSLFDLVEYATFAYADELIFTNENQMTFMLKDYPDSVKRLVRDKAIVRPHPTPSQAAYHVVESDFAPVPGALNLGYFGSFYSNRGLDEVFVALANLSAGQRRKVVFHVFCNAVSEATLKVNQMGLSDCVRVRGYLPYMEFLNAVTKFDVLVVNDINRDDGFEINPFLPSKLSDYRGSGAKIWALVDEGSPLSRCDVDFVSAVGNQVKALTTLREIVGTLS